MIQLLNLLRAASAAGSTFEDANWTTTELVSISCEPRDIKAAMTLGREAGDRARKLQSADRVNDSTLELPKVTTEQTLWIQHKRWPRKPCTGLARTT